MGAYFSAIPNVNTLTEDSNVAIVLKLRNLDLTEVIDENKEHQIPLETVIWNPDKNLSTVEFAYQLFSCDLTISMQAVVNSENQTLVGVEIQKLGYGFAHGEHFQKNFLQTIYFNFGEGDFLGYYVDLMYGKPVLPGELLRADEFVLKNLYSFRKITIDMFNPVIHSYDGTAIHSMWPISTMKKSSGFTILRGPTFYTSECGYRVKFDLIYKKIKDIFEVKITFLSGKFDDQLTGDFRHITSIALYSENAILGDKNVANMIQGSVEELARTKSYKYILGSPNYLETKKILIDDKITIYVNIKPFTPVVA